MRLALMQAKKNLGNTSENPAVGCVIVKNNFVISSGSTGIKGRPHAEQNAISYLRNDLNESYLYVTLEPCSNYGKTSPCVKSIIKNKIKKVFFSLKDPDSRSNNKSTKQFKKNRVKAHCGILSSEMKNFYRSYFKNKLYTLPFVTAKMAVSKDYFTKNKKGKWITNEFSRGRVHLMRKNHDCILSSSKTIADDNSSLTCRILGLEKRSPVRIILDKKLETSIRSTIVKTACKYRTIIFYNKNNKKKIKVLKNLKIKLVKTSLKDDGSFDIKKILFKIKKFGFSRIFLESGLKLTTYFLREGLIDDFHLFISGKKLGNNGSNNFKKVMKLFFKNIKFVNEKVNLHEDKLITYRFT
jgi:diaminohydroxyphosphoribosylaminopyrimidine deaminase/5-amino-6-(5-phosphoribosylamino)uracil reductase